MIMILAFCLALYRDKVVTRDRRCLFFKNCVNAC